MGYAVIKCCGIMCPDLYNFLFC